MQHSKHLFDALNIYTATIMKAHTGERETCDITILVLPDKDFEFLYSYFSRLFITNFILIEVIT